VVFLQGVHRLFSASFSSVLFDRLIGPVGQEANNPEDFQSRKIYRSDTAEQHVHCSTDRVPATTALERQERSAASSSSAAACALYAHATEFEVLLPDVPNAQDFMLMSAFGNGGAVRHIAFKTKSQ
jgi:hypothetical protein